MVSAPCVEGDLDGDGDYDAEDARAAMVDFGIIEASSCPADINGDGEVGADDLGLLLSAWGVCVP
jgi:hypothetical protein